MMKCKSCGFESEDGVHSCEGFKLQKANDVMKGQVGGDHYKKHTIQTWHIVDEYKLNYYLGNALKYILRDKGNKREDIEKSIHYLQKELANMLENPNQLKLDLGTEE